jgi:23S rRNA pseudouridine2605 synthase
MGGVDGAAEAAGRGERIAKALARAGVCSRRDAERLIADGRIAVNGTQLTTPATLVGPRDRITLDGTLVERPEAVRLWRYHKPAGLVTTHKDPAGRPTVFEHLPEGLPRVISVGRLDLTTEGLLLLTNDGELARALELPSTGVLRRYRVRAFGRVDVEELARLREGITVDGVAYGPVDAVVERAETANAWLTVSLREGRNREVRKVLEAVGLQVNRLIRVSYGPFQLGNLEAGAAEEVPNSALPEMLGKLMPAAPVRGERRAVADASAGQTGKPKAASAVRGKGAASGPASGKRDLADRGGRPGRPQQGKPKGDKLQAAKLQAGKPQAGKPRTGKRRLDAFEEEAAIAATLAQRRSGKPAAGGSGTKGAKPVRAARSQPGDGRPPRDPAKRPHSSTRPNRHKP